MYGPPQPWGLPEPVGTGNPRNRPTVSDILLNTPSPPRTPGAIGQLGAPTHNLPVVDPKNIPGDIYWDGRGYRTRDRASTQESTPGLWKAFSGGIKSYGNQYGNHLNPGIIGERTNHINPGLQGAPTNFPYTPQPPDSLLVNGKTFGSQPFTEAEMTEYMAKKAQMDEYIRWTQSQQNSGR
jgi:hypothetical protein